MTATITDVPPPTNPANPVGGRRLLLLSLALMSLTALMGICASLALPLDDHELLVAEMAREMRGSGDWVVPTFNGGPRLNKPPLNLWLAVMVSHLDPRSDRVEGWHARVVSVLAGVAIVGLTIRLGSRLLGPRIGLLAGGLVATTAGGMMNFIYSARPDMLYAALCLAGLTAFLASWQSPGRSSARLAWSLAMWVAFAFATLCKGPHVPGLFLLGILIYVFSCGAHWRAALDALRPWPGIILYAVIATPWWALLCRRVGYSTLSKSQLSGQGYGLHWWNIINPDAWMGTLGLLTPWFLLVPVAFWALARPGRIRQGLLLPGIVTVVTLVGFVFANKQRGYYALPLLGPLALLLASGAEMVLQWAARRERDGRLLGAIAAGHAVVAVVLLVILAWRLDAAFRAPRVVLALAALAIVPLFLVLQRRPRSVSQPLRQVLAAMACVWLTLLALSIGARAWKSQPFSRAAFARQVAALVSPDQPLYSTTERSNVVVFYGGRRVILLPPRQLTARLQATAALVHLIVPTRNLTHWPANLPVRVLARTHEDPEDDLALVQAPLVAAQP